MGFLKTRAGYWLYLLIIVCLFNSSSLWAIKSASIVMCAETGMVHFEQDADAITHPASLTKMMTLYLTFKALRERRLSFEENLPVSKHATEAAPSKLWLKPGSTLTVRQAIMALVTKSANDASVVLAEKLGRGSEDFFAVLMTQQAHKLGMSNTIFKNAHGLPNKDQVTTARDMAILSRSLYKHFPEYFKFFKEPQFAYKGKVHKNHNHLLGKIPGIDGIKTGFINASGFNLAASMVRDNQRIIAVVLGGESIKARDNKMVHLLESTYSYLNGSNDNYKEKKQESIGNMVYALSKNENQKAVVPKSKGHIQKAVFQTQSKPKYLSVSHLLNDLNEDKPKNKKIHKSSKKNPSRIATKNLKKSSQKKLATSQKKNVKISSKKKIVPIKSKKPRKGN